MNGDLKTSKAKRSTAELAKDPISIRILQETLHELGQKYISLLEHSRQGIMLFQKDPPSPVWANAAMAKHLGLGFRPIKFFPLQTLKILLHPEDRQVFFDHYRDCLKGKPVPLNHPIRATKKDRTPIWLEYSFVRVGHLGHPAALGIFMDLTERKHLEEGLQASQKELNRRLEEQDSELSAALNESKKNEEELKLKQEELTKISQELWETNKAITVLARNIDKTREETERKVAVTIGTKIIPLVENLKKEKMLEKHRAELEVLSVHLKDLLSENEKEATTANTLGLLSPIELRIAALIKNGLASKDITSELNISIETVKTHRRNIRKKLQLHDADTNLSTFLRSKAF
ncbi:MAG: hypothetical protein HY879_10735 [Deltaproteobacteria bacterium]|nr:hypothetical protein [Deltaproteobacteria bacterium]